MDVMRIFASSLRRGFETYRANWQALASAMAAYLVIKVIAGQAVGQASKLDIFVPEQSFFISLVIVPFVFLLAEYSVTFSLIRHVNEASGNKKKTVMAYFSQSIVPALKYLVLMLAVLGIPFFLAESILQVAGGASDVAAAQQFGYIVEADYGAFLENPPIFTPVSAVLAALALLYGALLFFTQFTMYHLAASGKGFVDSVKNSIHTTTSSIVRFFILWLLFGILSLLFSFGDDILWLGVRQVQLNYIDLTDLAEQAYAILNYTYKAFVVFPLLTIILIKYWRIASGFDKP